MNLADFWDVKHGVFEGKLVTDGDKVMFERDGHVVGAWALLRMFEGSEIKIEVTVIE